MRSDRVSKREVSESSVLVPGGQKGGYQFKDNRQESHIGTAIKKGKNNKPAHRNNTNVRQDKRDPVQFLAIADVDYASIGNVLKDEPGVIADLKNVDLYFCEGIESTKDDSPYDAPVYVPFGGQGVTFPHENPPKILISMENNDSLQELTATVYHELYHAMDPDTPVITDESNKAKRQDLANEGKTWKEELLFTIRHKDKLPDQFQSMLSEGFVTGNEVDGYEPSDSAIGENIEAAYTDEYKKESRMVRFDPDRYKTSAKQKYNPDLMDAALK